jgi:catechol 2,3-dioxygenase-like lactoylglutathione lyase family enzyme
VSGEDRPGRPSEAATAPSERSARERRSRVEIVGIDHVQLPMPPGEEPLARLFYTGVLGLTEVRKPQALVGRGGAWFVGSTVSIHLGVEDPILPRVRAHPAFQVRDLEEARRALESAGVPVIDDPTDLPIRHCYVRDPFGNRIELIDERDGGFSLQRPRR